MRLLRPLLVALAVASPLVGQTPKPTTQPQLATITVVAKLPAVTPPPVVAAPPVASPPSQGAQPILVEDFSTYKNTAALHANTTAYYPEEQGGPYGQWSLITLDTTSGVAEVGAGTSTRSMKFTWPDRTNYLTPIGTNTATSNRCTDFYTIKALKLPPNTRELWVEFYVKFSTTFTTKAPDAWGCRSNPDYKFIFLTTLPGSRFSLKNDYAGVTARGDGRWDPTAPGQGDGDNNFVYNTFHDGKYHRLRLHSKIATSGANGAHEIWLDGKKVYSNVNITTAGQTAFYSIQMGANLNQGPDHMMSVNWGQVKAWSVSPGW